MQIGNSVYVDIRVKGSDQRGILTFDNMKELQLVETAGTSLPYICLSFFTLDKNLADLFMQNNQIEVSIGQTAEDAETFVMSPLRAPKDTDPSGETWTIECGGFIGDNTYMMDKVSKAYVGNSLMVAKKVLKNFTNINNKIDTNITSTNENQVIWRQSYETTSSFLVDTLLHMDIRPSFPLFAFDKYGKFHVRSYNSIIEGEPVWRFKPTAGNAANEIQYLNNFNVESFKPSYNLYSGYNKVTEIYNATSGIPEYVVNDNVPVLASTEESETSGSGNRVTLNKIQSANVHKTYVEAYAHNTNKLMSLSSMLGCLQLIGYYPKLKPTDLVYVETDKTGGSDSTLEGLYLIDTIVTTPNFRNGTIITYVYVTRDNKNNVENYITAPENKINVTKKFIQDLINAISNARVALAVSAQIMDGTFTSAVRSFLMGTKNNLLRMFSVSGTILDFNGQARMLQSMLCTGNSIMNTLLSMIFPNYIAITLRDFLIDKPSNRELVGKYIDQYVPFEVQSIVSSLVDSLFSVHDSLNSIAVANGITAREIPTVARVNSSFNAPQNRIANILTGFENNTTGLDIPFPIVELTESQELLPDEELKELVASETIDNLTDLGYLDGVDKDEFKDILLGKSPVNFNIINQINSNAGDIFNYRFWGTFGASNQAMFAWVYGDSVVYTKSDEIKQYTRLYNADYSPYTDTLFRVVEDAGSYCIMYEGAEGSVKAERDESLDINSNALSQLTSFYIAKGYKDRYRTIPCTKLISATKNARLYFACPQSEQNLKFYINSKRVELESFPIDLGYVDVYGAKILYNVYFTNTGYNSNSTLLEVRQG